MQALDIEFFFLDGNQEEEDEDAGDGENLEEDLLSPHIYEYEVEATIRRVLLPAGYLGYL